MTAKTAKTTKTQYALMGWTIVQIVGIHAESGFMVAQTLDGETVIATRNDFLSLVSLRRVKAARVILGDEIVAAQVGSVSKADTNGNRWAVVKVQGELIVVHTNRVLVN